MKSMKTPVKRKYFFVVLVLLTLFFGSCSLFRKQVKPEKPDKEMVQYQKSIEAQYKDAKKGHYEKQSERTKDMMKATSKRSDKLNKKRGKNWFQRLLGL